MGIPADDAYAKFGEQPAWAEFRAIAKEAGVPIAPGFLDYAGKRSGIGPLLYPTGDVERDIGVLRAFYADKKGLFPDQFSEVRFERSGDAAAAQPVHLPEPVLGHGEAEAIIEVGGRGCVDVRNAGLVADDLDLG